MASIPSFIPAAVPLSVELFLSFSLILYSASVSIFLPGVPSAALVTLFNPATGVSITVKVPELITCGPLSVAVHSTSMLPPPGIVTSESVATII